MLGISSNLKVMSGQYDLLQHVKVNNFIIICHYSVCVVYDLSKVIGLLNY